MDQNFDIVVPIRQELMRCLIFGLKARLPIGLILGFLDFRHVVIQLM